MQPQLPHKTPDATYFNSVTGLGERAAFQEKPTQERIDLWEKVREEGCVLPGDRATLRLRGEGGEIQLGLVGHVH